MLRRGGSGERLNKEKVTAWIKKYENLAEALLMMLLPLVCCAVTCALDGQKISGVYLPASEWNDELFYFKQVEGVVNCGFSKGFFGFNESHAIKLSFAAWSPVLVWPWIVWGMLFGWNIHSPIYCNIALMMIAMFGFVRLSKPTRKQLGILFVLYIAFTPFTRYMLSGMPEVICFFMVVMTLSLGISYIKKEHTAKLTLLFVITFIMVLMRPYLIVFMLLPCYFLIRKMGWKGMIAAVLLACAAGGCYIAIKHYFGAEYFAPLFDTTWVSKFIHEGIGSGIRYIFLRLWDMGGVFMKMLWEGVRNGQAAGARFAGFILLLILLLGQSFRNYRKKEDKQLIVNLYLSVCFIGMWGALLLMYKMDEGSKHLLTFIAVGVFAVSLMETRFFRKMTLAAAAFIYLYGTMAVSAYEYQIPYQTAEREKEVDTWKEVFDKSLTLSNDDVISFDNVIIWVFEERIDGEWRQTPWQYLYALPEGFGISCCGNDFVTDHFEYLQSKYLAVSAGGGVEELCMQKGLKQIGGSGGMVVYELH